MKLLLASFLALVFVSGCESKEVNTCKKTCTKTRKDAQKVCRKGEEVSSRDDDTKAEYRECNYYVIEEAKACHRKCDRMP